jgi:diguanylate cyclase (GGDEF)-like protein/PAS domain S-box-containing protein
MAQAAPVGLCVSGRASGITRANATFLRILDRPRSEVLGWGWLTFVHPDDRERVDECLAATRPTDGLDFRILLPEGEVRWVRFREADAGDLDVGEPGDGSVIGSLTDITKFKHAEQAMREKEGHLQYQALIFEMIATGAMLHETLTEIAHLVEDQLSDAVATIQVLPDPTSTPRLQAEVPEADRDDLVLIDLASSWVTPISASSDGRILGTVTVQFLEPRRPTDCEIGMLDAVSHVAAIAIEHKQSQNQLAIQAQHDPLTGLPNRLLFGELLGHALARSQRMDSALALLFIDLDRFKVINDKLGHDVGDEVLVMLAQRLDQMLRPGDVLARFGGDEFTLLCEDLEPAAADRQAVGVAERVIDAFRDPFVIGGEDQFLGASIGIAIAYSGKERPEDLLRDADAAMYRAKERGRGRVAIFDEHMRDRVQERHELEHALCRALERGEFRVFYQPVISLADGSCAGVEALLRWQHPKRGLLAPAEFLPTAESTGLIMPIGAWLLEEACRAAVGWRASRPRTPEFRVSVNLSARQLVHNDIGRMVTTALERTGLEPDALCVEITETILMEDVDAGVGAMKALKALGVRPAIDDFGTGYSALGYLRKFPIDEVKIDRSFVERLGTDPDDSAIVAAVVSLGHVLGVTVTGEGVETRGQLEELRALGVDAAQGFLLAPPQPPRDITPWLSRSRAWV